MKNTNAKGNKIIKSEKLYQDENVNSNDAIVKNNLTRLSPRKDSTKHQQFYWDWCLGAHPSVEVNVRRKCQEKFMSHGKAKSVLGLWGKGGLVERKRNLQEEVTEEDILEAFRKESTVLEFGGINEEGYTLQDFHEAYQVLLKTVTLKRKLRLKGKVDTGSS